MSYLIRHKVSKAVQSKDTEKPDDQVLQPVLMLLGQLRKPKTNKNPTRFKCRHITGELFTVQLGGGCFYLTIFRLNQRTFKTPTALSL